MNSIYLWNQFAVRALDLFSYRGDLSLRLLALFSIAITPAVAAPSINITAVPTYGEAGSVQGTVNGVDFSQYRVATLVYVPGLGWYTKPYYDFPTVEIDADGNWSANVVTGGLDHLATIYGVWLVPADYSPPLAGGNVRMPIELKSFPHDTRERYGRTIDFAGRTWAVKDAPAAVGPGSNLFSDLASDVWADAAGLHLSIHQHDGYWWSTEVTLLGDQLGYGTYWYHTDSRTDILDVNLTFGGGFLWDDYGDEESPDGSHNREVDIGEDSRWGNPADSNTQNVKQPYNYPPANGANRHRFNLPDLSSNNSLTRILVWRPDSLHFITLKGHYSPGNYPANAVVDQYIYTHNPTGGRYVPVPGRERIHFNLWMNNGAPSNGQPVEILISKFSFAPLDDLALGSWAERKVVRNLPTAVGHEVDIGTLTFTGGTGIIDAAVNASGSGWSVAKRYVIPIRYNLGNGSPPATWLKVLPTHDTGPYGTNDFDLDVNVSGKTAKLRLRTVGSSGNAATARIAIKTIGLQTFVNKSVTAEADAPAQTVGGNAVDEVFGKAGIGVAPSGNGVLDVNGGDTRGLRLRARPTANAPATGTWNAGTIILDSLGNLYICTAPGTPGTWKKVGN